MAHTSGESREEDAVGELAVECGVLGHGVERKGEEGPESGLPGNGVGCGWLLGVGVC
jgi:hypothetical protein